MKPMCILHLATSDMSKCVRSFENTEYCGRDSNAECAPAASDEGLSFSFRCSRLDHLRWHARCIVQAFAG